MELRDSGCPDPSDILFRAKPEPPEEESEERSYCLTGSGVGPYWIIEEKAGLIRGHSDALSKGMMKVLIGLLGNATTFGTEPAFAELRDRRPNCSDVSIQAVLANDPPPAQCGGVSPAQAVAP